MSATTAVLAARRRLNGKVKWIVIGGILGAAAFAMNWLVIPQIRNLATEAVQKHESGPLHQELTKWLERVEMRLGKIEERLPR